MAEIAISHRLDALNHLGDDLRNGNGIDPVRATELISDVIQELQTTNDKISALEEGICQRDTDSSKLKTELDIERALMGEVFRQSPAGIVVVDAQSGKAIRANALAKRIMRCEDVLSRSIENHNYNLKGNPVLLHLDGTPYEAKEMPPVRSILFSEVVTDEELIFNRKDGLQGVLNISSGPVFDGGGKVVAAVATFFEVRGKDW